MSLSLCVCLIKNNVCCVKNLLDTIRYGWMMTGILELKGEFGACNTVKSVLRTDWTDGRIYEYETKSNISNGRMDG